MEFHTFGDSSERPVILIHGVFTPWQIWEKHIAALKDEYYIIVPALDGHIAEHPSEFISCDDEAAQIEAFVKEDLGGEVYALCGLSMGGFIADRIYERGNITIKYLIMDGAPLLKAGALPVKFMTVSYKDILHKAKRRDRKTLENFRRDFLPEEFLPMFLSFADTMTDSTVENMLGSVFGTEFSPRKDSGTRILYMHGTAGNEVYSVKAAKALKRSCPDAVIKQFDGMKHAELAVYHPDKWVKTVRAFLEQT